MWILSCTNHAHRLEMRAIMERPLPLVAGVSDPVPAWEGNWSKGRLKSLQPKYLQPADFTTYPWGFPTTGCDKGNQSTTYCIHFTQKRPQHQCLARAALTVPFLVYAQLQSTEGGFKEGFFPTLHTWLGILGLVLWDHICHSPGYPQPHYWV